MQNTRLLTDRFIAVYGHAPRFVTFAPGRINLIGEHTDYNGGHVMPCALDMGVSCAAAPRTDGLLRFVSLNLEGEAVVTELGSLAPQSGHGWAEYPEGVFYAFAGAGLVPAFGADLMYWGDIPAGAGLSSSAAIEAATALMLCELYGFSLSGERLAVLCRAAENEYVGVKCGVMDQFASIMGKSGNAVFLNTSTLGYEYAPLELDDAEIVIVNSNFKHSLAGSEYNTRRAECEAALAALQRKLNIACLCGLTPEEFERNARLIEDPVVRKRAKHAVYEEARTVAALKELKAGNIAAFGRLMNESHISLRDDYEVSCEALDILTELAWACPGVIGARMTGGGFGGSMVSIVKKAAVPEFSERISEGYLSRTGLKADIMTALPADGARTLARL